MATKNLFKKLNEFSSLMLSDQKILIGHQNAFHEGRGWRLNNSHIGENLKSDMYAVSAHHPALVGIDFLEVGPENKNYIVSMIKEVHRRKGVITLSWHMPALIDDGKGDGSYSDTTTKIVSHILPGKDFHFKLKEKMDELISFLNEFKEVPVIFRPWHEHNRSWFWWGSDHSTQEEYIKLWRWTIDYLMEKGVHHLLYAYSPSTIDDNYFERYPGDEYVDILGVDHYFYNPSYDIEIYGPEPLRAYQKDLVWLCKRADERKKIPAVTEFGLEATYYEKFWTKYMAYPLTRKSFEDVLENIDMPKKGIAYIMLWRNDRDDPKHFYGPVPGHKNNNDFMKAMRTNIFKTLSTNSL